LEDFKKLLDEMVKASAEIPEKIVIRVANIESQSTVG